MSRKNKSFSPQFERDYSFYLSNKNNFTLAGSDIKKDYGIQFPDELGDFSIPFSLTGKSAKVCFWLLDSQGKRKSCSEPQLLLEILRCKAAINLQIKIWAESRAEYTLSKFELEDTLNFYQAPEWVFKAIENQKSKILNDLILEKKYNSDFCKQAFIFHFAEILRDLPLDI